MRSVHSKGRRLLVIAFSLAACTRHAPPDQSQDDVNLTSYDASVPVDQSGGATTDAEPSPDVPTMNIGGSDESAAGSPSDTTNELDADADLADARTVSGRIWVGMSGVPQGCTLTNYHSVDDAAFVLEQNGATLLRKSPNLVVLIEHAPNGEFKTVFANDQGLCENVVAGSAFATLPPNPPSEKQVNP